MDKKALLAVLLLPLILQLVSVRAQAQETVSNGVVVSDSVSPGQTKAYCLSENLTEDSFVTLSVKRISGEGKFTLQKDSKQIGEYSVHSYNPVPSPLPFNFCPFVLTENGTGYAFNVSVSSGESFEFSFFYDISDILASSNSKTIPFETGAVGYYVDLDRGDELWLNLTPPENAEFDVLVTFSLFGGYSGSVFASVASTFLRPSPKITEFVTDYSGRFMVFVVSTSGTGNFSLSSLHTGNPIEGALENLRNRVDYLNNLVNNLIVICVASFFVSFLSVYLYWKLRKTVQQASTVSAE